MVRHKKEAQEQNAPIKKLTNGIAVKERAPLSGAGNDTPIVFLHGSGYDCSVFDAQFQSQTLAHHHLIAMDLPGHGQSDNAKDPQSEYSYAGMGDKILEALNLMGFQNAIFVGWSLGAQIAIEMHHDDRVKAVFVCGCAPIAPGPMGMIRGFHFSRDLLLTSKAKFTRAEAKRFESACLGDKADGQFVDSLLRVDPALRPVLSKMVLKGFGLDQKNAVENPEKPICILQGENDPFIRTDYIKGLDALGLFTKEVIILEDCGHAPFVDAAESFDLIVSDFAEWVEINAFAFDRALMNVRKAA